MSTLRRISLDARRHALGGIRRRQERDRAGDVRRRHRGAVPRGVAGVVEVVGDGAEDADSRRRQVDAHRRRSWRTSARTSELVDADTAMMFGAVVGRRVVRPRVGVEVSPTRRRCRRRQRRRCRRRRPPSMASCSDWLVAAAAPGVVDGDHVDAVVHLLVDHVVDAGDGVGGAARQPLRMNLRAMISAVQHTPATPMPLLPTAAMVPEVWVPWPLSSMGSVVS